MLTISNEGSVQTVAVSWRHTLCFSVLNFEGQLKWVSHCVQPMDISKATNPSHLKRSGSMSSSKLNFFIKNCCNWPHFSHCVAHFKIYVFMDIAGLRMRSFAVTSSSFSCTYLSSAFPALFFS